MPQKLDPASANEAQLDAAVVSARPVAPLRLERRSKARPEAPEEESPRLNLLSELWPAFAQELDRRADGCFEPVSTGLPALDQALGGGFPRGAVTVLPAAPGTGKTTLMLWVGLDRAKEGTPVIFWSLELTAVDALARLVSILQGQPWGEVRRGLHPGPVKLTGEQVQPFPFAVHGADSCPTVEAMAAVVEAMAARYGKAPLLVIDYAQLLIDELASEVRSSASALSKDVAALAGRTGAAVVAISSVGRASYNVMQKGRPDLDRVLGMAKESGQFEYDAAAVLALVAVRDPEGEPGRHKKLWAVIAKHRFMAPGRTVPLEYDGMTGRWQEIGAADMPVAVGAPKVKPEVLREQILDLVERRGPELTSANKVAALVAGRKDRTLAMLKALVNQGELAGGNAKEPYRLTGELAKDAVLALFQQSHPAG